MEIDPAPQRKTFVVDTSILVSTPDALHQLVQNNTVLIPFPVLQELDRRRSAGNGTGYAARNVIRLLDDLQQQASLDELRSGIPLNGGTLRFHDGRLETARAWPGFNPASGDDAIIQLAGTYQEAHPDQRVMLVTRDAAMRCKARARAVIAEDYYSDRPVVSLEKFYSGRVRINLSAEHAGLLSILHQEQRLPVERLEPLMDVSQLRTNQCCELLSPSRT